MKCNEKRLWSQVEVMRLHLMAGSGMSCREIARELGRTETSIRRKMDTRGLTLRKEREKAGIKGRKWRRA